MIKPSVAWSKARKGQVLNLSELAVVTGYYRGQLAEMQLPLDHGKISHEDFKRVMRNRQDRLERKVKLRVLRTPIASSPASNGQRQARADKFYAPSSKRAGTAASHQLPQALLLGTG